MADIMQILGIFKQFKFGLLSMDIRLKLTPFALWGLSPSWLMASFMPFVLWERLSKESVLSLLRAAIWALCVTEAVTIYSVTTTKRTTTTASRGFTTMPLGCSDCRVWCAFDNLFVRCVTDNVLLLLLPAAVVVVVPVNGVTWRQVAAIRLINSFWAARNRE